MRKNFGLAAAGDRLAAARSAVSSSAPMAADDVTAVPDDELMSSESTRMKDFIASRRPAAGVATVPWSMGVGDVIASHPSFPTSLTGVAGRLNRAGGVSISPTTVAIDGESVDWQSISAIRTRGLVDHLLSGALSEQLDSLPLPAFPGRKRLVDAVGRSVFSILMATARDQVNGVGGSLQIPAEIEYRGKVRRRRVVPNVISTLLLADPSVNACLFATAQAHRVTIHGQPSSASTSGTDGAEILTKLEKLEAQFT